ncbi:MAG TPA: indole-3-glycerol-phosphate synthase [Candidatus Altiarchaeales archaeon]|nr:indole-3-glycerol-phosphate synthase [Candidatus Altiarchaeales archaeon]
MRFNFETIDQEKLNEIREIKEKRSLISAIERARENGKNPVIAEVKRKSPSIGKIREIDLLRAAMEMERGGAVAVSVLTDRYFDGKLDDLRRVKKETKIPVMRKDFIVDEFQIYESYAYGADAVLLIATILLDRTSEFVKKTHELGMDALVEIHSKEELKFALNSGARLIGINNRDLTTLRIELGTTEILAKKIPSDRIIVAESGINNRQDLERVFNAGASVALIGTSIMQSENIEEKVKEFVKK